MSHFFNNDSSSSTDVIQKKKKKIKKKQIVYTLDSLPPTSEISQFIQQYIKNTKKMDPLIANKILDVVDQNKINLPKNLKNVLSKCLKKDESVYEQVPEKQAEELEEEPEEFAFERRISECMESEKGVEMIDSYISHYSDLIDSLDSSLNQTEPRDPIELQLDIKDNTPRLSQLEKLIKAKLSLYNQSIYHISYVSYKKCLTLLLSICNILNKPVNKLFYIKMLMKTKYDKPDLVNLLSGIEEAKKIYFDFLFFEEDIMKQRKSISSKKGATSQISSSIISEHALAHTSVLEGNRSNDSSLDFVVIEEEKLDDEFKLIYFIRTDYNKAVSYYKEHLDTSFNCKIMREFCVRTFQENDLQLTNEILNKIEQNQESEQTTASQKIEWDDKLENIAMVLEIIGIRPLNIIKSKFVILEKNQLLLRSLNKKMELMRAYFLKINYDYEGSANIIKSVMGVEVGDIIVPEHIY